MNALGALDGLGLDHSALVLAYEAIAGRRLIDTPAAAPDPTARGTTG